DHLAPGLDIVFVGINPGAASSTQGRHYAHAGNHFWPSLCESGLNSPSLKLTLPPTDDSICPSLFSLGFTNLCPRATRSQSDLTRAELRAGIPPLLEKLALHRPRICCFVGMDIYRVFSGSAKVVLGLQRETVNVGEGVEVKLFCVPSTSGRVSAYSRGDRVRWFLELKRVRDEMK
ncbi:uracil-DNA glycosylase-like protein, partial [Blyttiomyces helicus]